MLGLFLFSNTVGIKRKKLLCSWDTAISTTKTRFTVLCSSLLLLEDVHAYMNLHEKIFFEYLLQHGMVPIFMLGNLNF